MIKRATLFGACLLALSAPALAYHCPADMKKIDAALADGPQLSESQMSEVQSLRAEGEADHKAGKHDDSVAKLGKAMGILGVE
jgi:hypothetical protein